MENKREIEEHVKGLRRLHHELIVNFYKGNNLKHLEWAIDKLEKSLTKEEK